MWARLGHSVHGGPELGLGRARGVEHKSCNAQMQRFIYYTQVRCRARTLDMASMAERNSGLGGRVGLSADSSTALVYRSSVRKHTSFSPNCCSSVSPCAWPAPPSAQPGEHPQACDKPQCGALDKTKRSTTAC